jgi:hypothetical protein
MNITTRLIRELVSLAKSYSDDADEAAVPEGAGRFAQWAMISLHSLQIFLRKSYVIALDVLETMTQILDVIRLESEDLPHPSTLNKWLNRIKMAVWRVLLRHSAQLHDPSPRVAVDATYYERSPASKHYCNRTTTPSRRSKRPNSLIRRLKPSSAFTAQPLEGAATLMSVRNSPGATQAGCSFSLPIRAMTFSRYVTHFITCGYFP